MNFSIEEIYFMYGQYDAFVALQFHEGTKSDELFGTNGIMGRFKYTLDEKKALETLRGSSDIQRTKSNFRFIPSDKHSLSSDIQTLLDREGLVCSDIAVISSFSRPRENRFIVKGEKEIPDKLTITIPESSQREIDLMTIGMLKSRLKDGELAHFELWELFGLLLFYRPEEVIKLPYLYTDSDKKNLKEEIKIHYLYCKYLNEKNTPEELEELKKLKLKQFDKKTPIVINEIRKNGLQISKLQDLDAKSFNKAISLISNVEDTLILPYKKPIWCDFERLAHIYLGHVKELYIGAENTSNTFFQYNFKELKNVISNVLQIAYDEFIEETKNGKTFGRRGNRALEFDGHFYRVEIEANGRLVVFHPYNDDREREKDN
jgi:hypothetical protein